MVDESMGKYDFELKNLAEIIVTSAKMYANTKPVASIKESELGVYDLISQNDIFVEDYIKNELRKIFPDDMFYCEESINSSLSSERTWVIDPIDGTINYVHDIPIYGTQAALLVDESPVISVLYLPYYDELYTAQCGCGAYLNGKKLNISRRVSMKESILSIGDYSKGSIQFRENQNRLMDVLHNEIGRIKMMGSSCYDFALFSSGRVDYHVRFVRNHWDFMPGFLMSIESGGVYDESLYDERKLFVVSTSKENSFEIGELIRSKMRWYEDNHV